MQGILFLGIFFAFLIMHKIDKIFRYILFYMSIAKLKKIVV